MQDSLTNSSVVVLTSPLLVYDLQWRWCWNVEDRRVAQFMAYTNKDAMTMCTRAASQFHQGKQNAAVRLWKRIAQHADWSFEENEYNLFLTYYHGLGGCNRSLSLAHLHLGRAYYYARRRIEWLQTQNSVDAFGQRHNQAALISPLLVRLSMMLFQSSKHASVPADLADRTMLE